MTDQSDDNNPNPLYDPPETESQRRRRVALGSLMLAWFVLAVSEFTGLHILNILTILVTVIGILALIPVETVES